MRVRTFLFVLFIFASIIVSYGRSSSGIIVETLDLGPYFDEMKNMSWFEFKKKDYISNVNIGYVFKDDYVFSVMDISSQIKDQYLLKNLKDSIRSIRIFYDYNKDFVNNNSGDHKKFKECVLRLEILAELIKDKYNAGILKKNNSAVTGSKLQFITDSLNLLSESEQKNARILREQELTDIGKDKELISYQNLLKSKTDSISTYYDSAIEHQNNELHAKLNDLTPEGYAKNSNTLKKTYNDSIKSLQNTRLNKINDLKSFYNDKIEFRSKLIESKKSNLISLDIVLDNIKTKWNNEIAKQSSILRKEGHSSVSYEDLIQDAENRYQERLKKKKL